MSDIDFSGLQDWSKGLEEAKREIMKPIEMEVTLYSDGHSDGAIFLKAMSLPDFFKGVLENFIEEDLLGPKGVLRTEFHKRADKDDEYWPKYRSRLTNYYGNELNAGERYRKGGISRRAPLGAGVIGAMDKGFTALWNALNTHKVTTSAGSAVAGIGFGDLVMGLRLNNYMGTSGIATTNSDYNSLFMAVEFGTGLAENVGAGNVRQDGKTKHPSGDGSWYFEMEGRDEGGHFLGQKGFHFLFDVRTRNPLPVYERTIRTELPRKIIRAVAEYKGIGVTINAR